MDVDKMIAGGTRLMSPKASAIYLWIGTPAGLLLLIGRINSNEMFVSIGGMIMSVIIQIMFVFFFAMTLKAVREGDDLKRLAIWKKAILLSISLVPICGLLLVQINLMGQLLGS